jgi:hypothetical protein
MVDEPLHHDDTDWMVEAFTPVAERLFGRLEDVPTEKDLAAIRAGLVQAFFAGYRTAIDAATYAYEKAAKEKGIDLQLGGTLVIKNEGDEWQEKYGEG